MTDPSLLLDDAPPPSHQGGDFDLGELLGRLRRRWRLIAAVAGLAVAVSLLQYHLTPPAFRAQTTIQIERRNLSPFANSWRNGRSSTSAKGAGSHRRSHRAWSKAGRSAAFTLAKAVCQSRPS